MANKPANPFVNRKRKEKTMKSGLGLVFVIAALLLPSHLSFAHPGGTDDLGCHHCWTNCSLWGLYYGQYHCHRPRPYNTKTVKLEKDTHFEQKDQYESSN